MTRKISSETANKKIKSALKAQRLLIGNTAVIRAFKTGKLEEVLYASNCPEHIKRDIAQYAVVGKTTVHEMGRSSLQLGELCGKPFTVLIIGIKK